MTFNSLDTSGHTVVVTVTAKLPQEIPAGPGMEARFDIAQFGSSQLEAMADDGSSLLLEAAAGVPETSHISITAPEGASTDVE